jgi:hypothetical protein
LPSAKYAIRVSTMGSQDRPAEIKNRIELD